MKATTEFIKQKPEHVVLTSFQSILGLLYRLQQGQRTPPLQLLCEVGVSQMKNTEQQAGATLPFPQINNLKRHSLSQPDSLSQRSSSSGTDLTIDQTSLTVPFKRSHTSRCCPSGAPSQEVLAIQSMLFHLLTCQDERHLCGFFEAFLSNTN